MKKFIIAFFVLFTSTFAFGQSFRYAFPFDFGMSVGRTSLYTTKVSYADATLPNNFITIGGKMCGFVFSFGYEIDFPNENVLGYCKQIKMDYTKYGFELGKLYYTSKRGKLHTFSIAPTYTKVYYSLSDGSGNNIGWTDYDNYERQMFYQSIEETSNGKVGGIGIDIGYTYQYFGIDLSITKKSIEISILFQLDLRMKWCEDYMGCSIPF